MSLRVAIAGAGALGLILATRLAIRGARVELYDGAFGPSASRVAAGMLSPGFEAALDPQGGSHDLLARGLGLWPRLLSDIGAAEAMEVSGALYATRDEAKLEAMRARLVAAGAEATLLSSAQARRVQPDLARDIAGAVHAPGEARIHPETLIEALSAAFRRAGGRFRAERLTIRPEGVDAVVLAPGHQASGLVPMAPELSVLAPIKGQLLNAQGFGLRGAAMVRGEGVYIAPQPGHTVVGATMEAGLSDLGLVPEALDGLRRRAIDLIPALAGAHFIGRAGVRAATPDGLPLAGPSRTAGVFLAAGARRNGWLLGPLIAEVVAAALLGEAPSPEAALFDPRRFG